MLIDGLVNSDSLPTLARAAQFAARRQELLAHNIANLSTPNFQPKDVSTRDFQRLLGEAVDERRGRTGGTHGELALRTSGEVTIDDRGGLALTPRTSSGNVLFHDRNDRDLERLMQDLVENLTAFRVAGDLLRSRMELLNSAIRERI